MTVYIITVTVLKKKKYLKEYNTRSQDKKHIPTTSMDVKDAIRFAKKPLANEILENILDPYDFGYKVEPLEIDG